LSEQDGPRTHDTVLVSHRHTKQSRVGDDKTVHLDDSSCGNLLNEIYVNRTSEQLLVSHVQLELQIERVRIVLLSRENTNNAKPRNCDRKRSGI
jgi:hypothetical protein